MRHEAPRISANKLAEYLTATARRRRSIIKDQKDPSTFKVAHYVDAYRILTEYVVSGMSDDKLLLAKIAELSSRGGRSDWIEKDRRLSAQVIKQFLRLKKQIDLGDYLPKPGEKNDEAYLHVSGVAISIRPDILLSLPESSGHSKYGGIKFSFGKSHPLGQSGCECAAALLYRYLLESETNVDHKKCICIDVPSGLVVSAPRAYKRTMLEIEDACEEIASRWSSI